MRRFLYFFVTTALAFTLNEQDINEFCKRQRHYNDQDFTCCAKKKYDSPKLYSGAKDEAMTACLGTSEVTNAKPLVAKSWLLYKCLVKGKIKGEITLDTFATFMVERYPSNIQTSIKSTANEVMNLIKDQKKGRRKRSLRIKRDEEGAGTGNSPENPTTQKPQEAGAAPDANPNGDVVNPPTQSGEGEVSDKEKDIPTTEKAVEEVVTTQKAAEVQTETDAPTTVIPVTPKPFYRYLSSFDYYDQFKKNIPDEDFFMIWDAYYVAEFQVCQIEGGNMKDNLMEYLAKRCLSWIQQTMRAGDCCGSTPVPLPLVKDPTMAIETIQNFTAEKIFTITGTYTWTNLSVSQNIDRCNRLAMSILQNKISLKELQQEIEDFAKENATIKEPNYNEIAKKLIPPYYPPDMEKNIITEILPPTTPPSKSGVKKPEGSYFDSILYDSNIQTISNFEYPVYQWAVASEWDSLDENQTRYLMWMCDAYRMVSQRIKFFDETPYCTKEN